MAETVTVSWFRSRLPFRYPFTTAKGTKTHQPALIVRLEQGGFVGWGEAPAISYYGVTVDRMAAELEQGRPAIEAHILGDPGEFWSFLTGLFPSTPFLVCALDMAAWDLCGKREQRPLMSMWGLDPNDVPISDYTIGMDAVPRMVEKMAALKWPVYKVKVGGAEDLEVLEALRAGTDAPFRVDANAAWEVEEALALLPRLTELGVELVEQPLAKGNDAGMGRLMEASSLPLIADESCVAESDVARCAGLFHGVNIKLTKCGGITPALRMIGQARALGMRVMIGSMSESTIGSSAIAHLSPLVDFLDNDGTLLLDGDVATGLQQVEGRLMPSGLPGLGVEVQAFDGDH